jgi:DNA-binding transcriptional ArsR family regulator
MPERRLADLDTVGEMSALMRLLGDPTRIRVLGLLQDGEMNVTALCGELSLAQPTVSHHLGLLRAAKLVLTRRAGKQIYYSLNPDHLVPSRSDDGGGSGLLLTMGPVKIWLAFGGKAPGRNGFTTVPAATAAVA